MDCETALFCYWLYVPFEKLLPSDDVARQRQSSCVLRLNSLSTRVLVPKKQAQHPMPHTS